MARKRRGGGDDGGGERWLATYGDAITLLMAFFVMLYAMSSVDVEKFNAFLAGLEGPFDNKSAVMGLLEGGPGVVGAGGAEALAHPASVTRPAQVTVAPITDPLVEESVGGDDARPASADVVSDQLEQVRAELEAGLLAAGLQPDVADYRRTERGLVVSIAADDVLFDSGSAVVGDTGQVIVAAVADVLKRFPNDVLVEGHTDDVPLRRGRYTNWNLSTDRAVAVLADLVERHGFPPQRLGAVGYGEQRPRVPNDSPEHRALNRRVDILVITLEAAPAALAE